MTSDLKNTTGDLKELFKKKNPVKQAVGWIGGCYRERPLLYGFFTLLAITLLMASISSLASPAGSRSRVGGASREDRGNANFRFVVDSLGRLDGYDHFRYSEMLRDALNQWLQQLNPTATWQPDPFVVKNVPPQLQQALAYPTVRRLSFTLEDARLIQGAAWMRDISNTVRERVAATHEGGIVDSLVLAEALFDWTMRNVALDEDDAATWEVAWESLLWGRAKAESRAWIFIELCRQQGIEAVMLAYRDPEKPGSKQQSQYRSWLPAVLVTENDENRLHLFDQRIGLPVPGPGRKGVATLAQAVEQPEILRQLDAGTRSYPVKSSDLKEVVALIDASPHLASRRMLHLQAELRGPDKLALFSDLSGAAERLRRCNHVTAVHAWIWPCQCLLNSRMQEPRVPLMQRLASFAILGFEEKGERNKQLENEHRERFHELRQAQPEAEDPAKMLKTESRRARAREVPGFLWKGRMLQFKGIYADPPEDALSVRKRGAPNVYQTGRLSDNQLDGIQREMEADIQSLRKQAEWAAKQPSNPPEVEAMHLARANAIENNLRRFPFERVGRQHARALASFWIGQVAYERDDYVEAVEYFRRFRESEMKNLRESDAKKLDPQIQQFRQHVIEPWLAVWENASRYNLARALEAAGQLTEAIDVYEGDTSPEQRLGSLNRARTLREKLPKDEKKEAATGKK
jgi:tetratricopeptide (TPR) repeat protein